MMMMMMMMMKLDRVILCFVDGIFSSRFLMHSMADLQYGAIFYINAHAGVLVLQTPSLKWG